MNFSANLNKVWELAAQESAAFKLDGVGALPFILGFLRDSQCDSAVILNHFGVTTKSLLPVVEEKLGVKRDSSLLGETSKLKTSTGGWSCITNLFEAYQHAMAHATALGHPEVDTGHMLLTILQIDSVKQAVLAVNVDHTAVMHVVTTYLNAGGRSNPMAKLPALLNQQTTQQTTSPYATAGGAMDNQPGATAANPQSTTPILDQFGRDLTKLAREGKLSPLIGRVKEVGRCIRILGRRTKANPLLLGEPGVGKTAIAEGIALRIVADKVPAAISGKRLIEIQLSTLVAGTKYRGEFEDRIKAVIKEASEEKVIIFFDELHTLVGGGAAEGALDASNILKPALARGEIMVIGATTYGEYRKRFQKDEALDRRFQPVRVEPATVAETIEILKGLKQVLEDHHKVGISDTAMIAAARLSDRYIGERHLPDKAIDLIDEAASALAIAHPPPPPPPVVAPPPPPTLLARILKQNPIARMIAAGTAKKPAEPPRVELSAQDVAELVSEITGVPVGDMEKDERDLLLNLEKTIGKRVIGQKPAIKAVAQAMRRARAGLRDPNRPAGSFLFLGPTGVGKTEVAKTLQMIRTGKIADLVRIDMSEYMEKHSVSRLIGAPPGYVGFDQAGMLTEPVRQRPYSVVLFDEIEKAHPDVFNVLLQVLDDGRLTDGQGNTVDFRNTIIIMTSNAGTEAEEKLPIGFAVNFDDTKSRLMDEAKKVFRPEFLNRVDEIVVFTRLVLAEIHEVMDILMSDLKARLLSEHNITLTLEGDCKALVVKQGYDPVYGARPLKRAIQKLVENPLAEQIIEGKKILPGMHLGATVKDGILDFGPLSSLVVPSAEGALA
jgi:ATPases with chaperone activity, ATP-binding subunit